MASRFLPHCMFGSFFSEATLEEYLYSFWNGTELEEKILKAPSQLRLDFKMLFRLYSLLQIYPLGFQNSRQSWSSQNLLHMLKHLNDQVISSILSVELFEDWTYNALLQNFNEVLKNIIFKRQQQYSTWFRGCLRHICLFVFLQVTIVLKKTKIYQKIFIFYLRAF